MIHTASRPFVAAIAMIAGATTLGCGSSAELEPVAESVAALNTCEETVPANRQVDGFPAYAQCEATKNSSIYSNNGIDTSTTSLGSDWIRTQQGGGYQCTELARRYMHFRWHIDYQNGDAGKWCDGRLPSTLVKSTTPVHGDLIVFAPGSCGASTITGHIAIVDTVNASTAKVTIVEENEAGRRSANQSCAACFLHAVANDGSVAGAGGAPSSGGAGGAPSTGGAGYGGAAGTASVPAQGGRADAESGGAPSGGMASGAGDTPPARAGAPSSAGGSGPAGQIAGAPAASAIGDAGTPSNTSAAPDAAQRRSEEPASCTVAHAPGTTPDRNELAWLGALVVGALFNRRWHATSRRLS